MFSSALKVINIFRFKKEKNHAEYDTSFTELKILGLYLIALAVTLTHSHPLSPTLTHSQPLSPTPNHSHPLPPIFQQKQPTPTHFSTIAIHSHSFFNKNNPLLPIFKKRDPLLPIFQEKQPTPTNFLTKTTHSYPFFNKNDRFPPNFEQKQSIPRFFNKTTHSHSRAILNCSPSHSYPLPAPFAHSRAFLSFYTAIFYESDLQ